MKRIPAIGLLLALLVPACGKVNRETSRARADPSPAGVTVTDKREVPFVRLAELEIDPAQLENYKAAVREEMEISVHDEAGVLAIYAVAEKGNPSRLRFVEMYVDQAAYDAHIESAHFRKYAETAKGMIVSRRLIDTVPVQLSEKKK